MLKNSLWGGILLVAGTSIGGGMLALPVLTSQGGFFPSLLIYLLCWLFMASTGLLFLELSLHFGVGSNFITMAEKTLGKPGKVFAWILYLYLFYCLTIAYLVGCGNLISSFSGGYFSDQMGTLIFTLIFAPVIWAGTRLVGPLNSLMMLILLGLYFDFVIVGFPHIDPTLLQRSDFKLSLIALPIAFTSFAYQGIIPTLVGYLDGNQKKARLSILIGSFIPLITYAIWQGLILGIIPVEGDNGLLDALKKGYNAIIPLKHFINNPWVLVVGQAFAFLALLTSFFGVALGLKDFLADGLKIEKSPKGRLLLTLIIFLPPLAIALKSPHIFLIALDYAGGYGCALLLGLLPIMMVWVKRYKQNNFSYLELKGGRPVLILLTLFVLFEIAIQLIDW